MILRIKLFVTLLLFSLTINGLNSTSIHSSIVINQLGSFQQLDPSLIYQSTTSNSTPIGDFNRIRFNETGAIAVADKNNGLLLYDTKNIEHPVLVDSDNYFDSVRDMEFYSDVLYSTSSQGLQIYYYWNNQLDYIKSIEGFDGFGINHIQNEFGNFLVVGVRYYGLKVFDISNETNPILVAEHLNGTNNQYATIEPGPQNYFFVGDLQNYKLSAFEFNFDVDTQSIYLTEKEIRYPTNINGEQKRITDLSFNIGLNQLYITTTDSFLVYNTTLESGLCCPHNSILLSRTQAVQHYGEYIIVSDLDLGVILYDKVTLDVVAQYDPSIYSGLIQFDFSFIIPVHGLIYVTGRFGGIAIFDFGRDNDGDNLTNGEESYIYHTLVDDYDTDDDGYDDGVEILYDSDPLDFGSIPTSSTSSTLTDISNQTSTQTATQTTTNSQNNPPQISSPSDIIFQDGDIGIQIVWILTDENPANYQITRNGEIIRMNDWINGETITVDLDFLPEGEYEYTLTAFDTDSLLSTDTVNVKVIIDTLSQNTNTNNGNNRTSTSQSPLPLFRIPNFITTFFVLVVINNVKRRYI